ncbi:nucleotidyltransferase family protein [Algoriphagus litoralis]|uniref:nucleotidyltransferase family protein n=1 Tax=Algoriphagus litoralis TaxID=2202829 RepID=UPI000DB9B2B5|nr:nucleotidyltransferase domain-containing protein [Algoriphagus litoralis]
MLKLKPNQQNQLESICKKHFVANLFLFGSAVSTSFSASSDLDFAVLFSENLSPLEHGEAFFDLKDDLERLFLRKVDLVSYRVVKNPVFKKELDDTKVLLYAA